MAGGTEQDYINTMMNSAMEIKAMRRVMEIQAAQLRVVAIFEAALGLKTVAQGYGEDMAWRLEKHAEAIKKDLERKSEEVVAE